MQPATTLFENGETQLMRVDNSGDLVVCCGGRDWFWPNTIEEGIEKMLKRDWDLTIRAMAQLVSEMEKVDDHANHTA